MKITEQLFKMPVIIYDGKQLRRAAKKEELNIEEDRDILEEVYVEFCICAMKLPIDEILGYAQSWSRDVTIEEAKEGALDCTLVMTRTLGDYLVYWKLSKFEQEYEAHYDKITEYIKSLPPIFDKEEGKIDDNIALTQNT